MLGYRKNALTGVTRKTFRFIWRNKTRYAVFFLNALFLFMVIEIAIGEGILEAESETHAASADGFPLPEAVDVDVLILALYSLATAFFAVPLHNFIINGGKSFVPVFPGRFLLFSLLGAIPTLFVSIALNQIAASVVGGVGIYAVPVLLLAALISGFYLVIALPFVAVTPVDKFKPSAPWKATSGFRLALFMRLFRLGVAFAIIQYGLQAGFSGLLPLLPPDDTIAGYYAPTLFRNIWDAAVAIVFITFASIAYMRLNSGEARTADPSAHQIPETVS